MTVLGDVALEVLGDVGMDAQDLAGINNDSAQTIANTQAETQRQGYGVQAQNNLATQQNAAARLGIDQTNATLNNQQTTQKMAADKQAEADKNIAQAKAEKRRAMAVALEQENKAKAQELGLTWLAEIGASGQVAGPDSTLQLQPANAVAKAAEKEGIAVGDIDLFELNEAFAAVGIESARQLGVAQDKVNVNGGAIALGHPVGMSGARIVLTLAHELKRRGGGIGAAALCGGGGQGDALIIRVPQA